MKERERERYREREKRERVRERERETIDTTDEHIDGPLKSRIASVLQSK